MIVEIVQVGQHCLGPKLRLVMSGAAANDNKDSGTMSRDIVLQICVQSCRS